MLKMLKHCSNCDKEDEFEEVDIQEMTTLPGYCPKCGCHKGEVEYYCNMTEKEFLNELANMTERTIAKFAIAIQVCADDLANR